MPPAALRSSFGMLHEVGVLDPIWDRVYDRVVRVHRVDVVVVKDLRTVSARADVLVSVHGFCVAL